MRQQIYWDDKCLVTCTDTDQVQTAEIMDFYPEKYLTVSIARQIKITLHYAESHDVYVGNAAGFEFQTKGPNRIS